MPAASPMVLYEPPPAPRRQAHYPFRFNFLNAIDEAHLRHLLQSPSFVSVSRPACPSASRPNFS